MHKLRSQLRGSFFIWFHFRSSYMIFLIFIQCHIHLFHGDIWTHNWSAPNISGFIAKLVGTLHRSCEVTGSNPVEVLNFFSGFSLRNCINCVHNYEDHSSFDKKETKYKQTTTKKKHRCLHEITATLYSCFDMPKHYINAFRTKRRNFEKLLVELAVELKSQGKTRNRDNVLVPPYTTLLFVHRYLLYLLCCLHQSFFQSS